jgi:hypothetical protein
MTEEIMKKIQPFDYITKDGKITAVAVPLDFDEQTGEVSNWEMVNWDGLQERTWELHEATKDDPGFISGGKEYISPLHAYAHLILKGLADVENDWKKINK